MNVLVTGGAGFIGSHLVDALISRGDRVVVIDDFSSGSKSNLPFSDRLEVIEFRLGDTVPAEMESGAFDAVVHLAGWPSVASSWTAAVEAHNRNLASTVALIDASSRFGIPRFIFASSAAVYGVPHILPIPEMSTCQPLSPYGLQKLTGEKYLELFSRQTGLCGISLRLFNVYGPRQRPDSAYSGAISIFAEAITKGETLTVYGDGAQTRDFVFVSDVVDAICAALSMPLKRGEALSLNIGTGVRSSLLDVIDALRSAFEVDASCVRYKENRSGDILHSQPDIKAAISRLGFRPKYSLSAGLRALVKAM